MRALYTVAAFAMGRATSSVQMCYMRNMYM